MDPAALVQHATPALSLLLVLTFLCLVGGLSLGAMLVSRKRLGPWWTGLGLGPLAIGTVGLNLWSAASADPADLEASQIAVAGATVVLVVLPFFALVPAFFHAILALGGALRDEPRRWLYVGIGALPLAVVIGAPLLGGYLVGSGFFQISLLRVIPYTVVGLLVLPALAAGGEEAGPDASASAGLALVTFVGLGEASLRGVFAFLMMGRFASLPDAIAREAFVANARVELLLPALPWSWVAFGAAAVLAVVSLVPGLRRHNGWTSLVGLVWIAAASLPMVLTDVPPASWAALAQALGGP